MPDFTMPFPGHDLIEKELSYDMCYEKIPKNERKVVAQRAWDIGAKAARDLFKKVGGRNDFFEIAKEYGLKCEKVDKDYIVGNQRYFSDYLSGKKRIRLYLKSIALWAKQNGLSRDAATHLILSHEFFHFLECTTLGLTSRIYQVPMLIVGKLKIGRTGIRALSEIGAHAFARTYYELANAE